MKDNTKDNLRYKQLLITNLVLMTIPSIFFVIAIITKLFNDDEDRITALIVLTVFLVLITINILLLIILRKYTKNGAPLPKLLMIISLVTAVPAIVGTLIRSPKYFLDLFAKNKETS